MLRSAASALRFGRTTSVASCYSSRPLQTAAAASPSPTPAGFPARSSSPPPLLARLVRVPESGVKMALELDKETEASAPGRRSDALFWEPLLVALRSSSPAKADLIGRIGESGFPDLPRFTGLIRHDPTNHGIEAVLLLQPLCVCCKDFAI